MTDNELKPCPFCGGTDIRLSIKRTEYPYWYSALYCRSCNCYGARTRVTVLKKGWISRVEIERSADVRHKAIEAWNRRVEQ